MGQMKIISCEPLVSDIKELIHRKQYHVLQVLNKYVINSHCELACMWLFLRICRHSANAVTEMKRSGMEVIFSLCEWQKNCKEIANKRETPDWI